MKLKTAYSVLTLIALGTLIFLSRVCIDTRNYYDEMIAGEPLPLITKIAFRLGFIGPTLLLISCIVSRLNISAINHRPIWEKMGHILIVILLAIVVCVTIIGCFLPMIKMDVSLGG